VAAINHKRVVMGALAGGVVWTIVSMLVNAVLLGGRYPAAQQAGLFLQQPRYPGFLAQWIVILFVLSWIVAILYASVRATCGAGPLTALFIGVVVGFAAGFPQNFAMATWSPVSRYFPLGWMIEMWGGAILAALVAGAVYKD
jgi:pilus assembly protein TadC